MNIFYDGSGNSDTFLVYLKEMFYQPNDDFNQEVIRYW
jgi:hypothetical protein